MSDPRPDSAHHHHRAGAPERIGTAVVTVSDTRTPETDTGGALGITNVPAFLGGSGDISAFLDHIDYAVKVVGADHVTIGTDRAYMGSRVQEEEAKRRQAPTC